MNPLSVSGAAADAPDRPFVVRDGQTWSFADVAQRVNALLSQVASSGEPTADLARPVVLVATNELRTLIRCLAAFELGRPVLLLHPRWSDAERRAVLQRAGVSDKELQLEVDRLTLAERLGPAFAAADPLAVVFTSGSSAAPKGVVLSRRAFTAAAHASAENLGWRPNDRWLLSLPLAHIGGLSVFTRCLAARTAVVLPTRAGTSFDPNRFVEEVERTATTLLSLVPTQLKRVVERRLRCPRSVRAVLIGGASLTEALREKGRALGWPLLTTYGMTETCSQVATERYARTCAANTAFPSANSEQMGRPNGICGPPLDGVEVRVTPQGLIEVRSPTLLSGYFPSEPAPLDDAGWFRTNDLGELLSNGELRVLGRADDLIISGGENIHPQQVEQGLLSLPGVSGACVFGLPSEDWGQVVAAAVVGEQLDLTRLRAQARALLGPIQCPKRWLLVEVLPLNPNGKLDRRRAQKELGPQCR